jgi:hypothetical protein
MSFTRFHDDPVRIKKRLEESTFEGRYQLDRPGPGVAMPFTEDPHQRLQSWGANIRTNSINIESDLRGMTRLMNRDHVVNNNYNMHSVQSQPLATYSSEKPYTDESRASDPAWEYRTKQRCIWEEPLLDPQSHVDIPFLNNIQTRILEKDLYRPV